MSFTNNGALLSHLSSQPMDELCDEKSRHRTILGYAVRGIQRRGENRESEKGALLTGSTDPRSALHFRRSGTGRPPKREGREEKMRDEVVPPKRTRRQTTWERVCSVVKPRERRGEKAKIQCGAPDGDR